LNKKRHLLTILASFGMKVQTYSLIVSFPSYSKYPFKKKTGNSAFRLNSQYSGLPEGPLMRILDERPAGERSGRGSGNVDSLDLSVIR